MTKKILNELFFGKDKDLLEIESLFRKVKDLEKLEKNILLKSAVYFSGEASAIFDQIETILERKFNIKSVILNIERTLNAYTVPALTLIGDPINFLSGNTYDLHKDSDGYKFKNQYPLMFVALGVPLIQNLEPDEITAILLHEIGHNFYNVNIIQKMFYMILVLPLLIIQILLLLFAVDSHKGIAENKVKENIGKILNLIVTPILEIIFNPIGFAVNLIKSNSNKFENNVVGRYFYFFISGLLNGLLTLLSIPMLVLNALRLALSFVVGDGMDNEKFADNFASMYGYGGALTTGLDKMVNIFKGNIFDEDKDSTNFIIKICNEISELMMVMLHALDVHPGVNFRGSDQLKYIDKEINNIKDPRAKKAMIEEKERILKSIKAVKHNDNVWGGKYGRELHYYLDWIKDKSSLNGKTVHNMEQNEKITAKLGFKKKQY